MTAGGIMMGMALLSFWRGSVVGGRATEGDYRFLLYMVIAVVLLAVGLVTMFLDLLHHA